MPHLAHRSWVPEHSETYVQDLANRSANSKTAELADRIEYLASRNRTIHEHDCFNLNPAANVMNPRAEAILATGLGSRPSLGYPGDKYEMGLEAIEEIEVIAADLCAAVFGARYAEIRVPSGAIANLYGFMATCQPGDTIIVPPADIGGHVTHHSAGCAGLYGLNIYPAPLSPAAFTVDVPALAELAWKIKPKLITLGGSLNLFPHPVSAVRAIADEVGAKVMFDAAHLCGLIAGGAYPNPLNEGAHLTTMSTYKSLAGPAGGLLVTNEASVAERLDRIAFPGMTANFDVAKSAALALTLLDWRDHGKAYATAMRELAARLGGELDAAGLPVFASDKGFTETHQLALEPAKIGSGRFGGGHAASKVLRQAGFLTSGIRLPTSAIQGPIEGPIAGDVNGIRLGTPELARWGMTADHMPRLASLIARALNGDDPQNLAAEVRAFRGDFQKIHYICE